MSTSYAHSVRLSDEHAAAWWISERGRKSAARSNHDYPLGAFAFAAIATAILILGLVVLWTEGLDWFQAGGLIFIEVVLICMCALCVVVYLRGQYPQQIENFLQQQKRIVLEYGIPDGMDYRVCDNWLMY